MRQAVRGQVSDGPLAARPAQADQVPQPTVQPRHAVQAVGRGGVRVGEGAGGELPAHSRAEVQGRWPAVPLLRLRRPAQDPRGGGGSPGPVPLPRLQEDGAEAAVPRVAEEGDGFRAAVHRAGALRPVRAAGGGVLQEDLQPDEEPAQGQQPPGDVPPKEAGQGEVR